MNMSPLSWPKPSIFPWCSLTYALTNLGIMYALASLLGNEIGLNWTGALVWSSPSWVFNVFFVWAEYMDYRREKNNYDGWNEEMRYLDEEETPKTWAQRVNQLRRPRG